MRGWRGDLKGGVGAKSDFGLRGVFSDARGLLIMVYCSRLFFIISA